MRGRELLAEARRLRGKLVAWRRHLHMYPEPSMEEHETAAFVVERLREIGVARVSAGVGGTGVLGLVRGRGSKTVALRADIDALELVEENEVEYRSRRPGLMHGCGHDAHVACLLGAAAILNARRERLRGNVKLIFQPGEEGAGGAARMIEEGALERPRVAAIAALHVDPDTPAGWVAVRRGFDTAQVDDVTLTVRGKTAHVAGPHEGADAIAIASQVLIAIQQFVPRRTNPMDRKLIGFGTIEGGTRRNVLADRVTLEGTIRTIEPEGRKAIVNFLKGDLRRLTRALGGRLELKIEEGYPPLVSDDRVVEVVEAAARAVLGQGRVKELERPGLGGEDFSYFALAGAPAAMMRLGTRDEKRGFTAPGHNSRFDLDDGRALPIGAAMLAATAMGMLERF